jgi:rhodanese-related sulfurtransferase
MTSAMLFAGIIVLMASPPGAAARLSVPVDIARHVRVIGTTPISGDADPVLWRGVLDVLPVRPVRIVILSANSLSPAARQKIRGLEAFVVDGDATVYVLRQAVTLRRAEAGDAFDRLVLASVIFHEMCHVGGLDEAAALGAEQTLWRGFVRAGRVEFALGMTYVQKLGDERERHLRRAAILRRSVAPTSIPPPRQAVTQAATTDLDDTSDEISTEELEQMIASGRATVLDARPSREFAIGHIPQAVNVAPRAGVPPSLYVSDVAEIGRLIHGNTHALLVLYCNGPHCGKSKRLAGELRRAGYTNVRRYQLGMPFWRASGRVSEIELDGISHILANDRTAVLIDAREQTDFQHGSLTGARNIPRSGVLDGKDSGEVKRAKDDGRLPMEDHNTRIVVIGADAASARFVAQALAREAFHNVAYFAGTFAIARVFLDRAAR